MKHLSTAAALLFCCASAFAQDAPSPKDSDTFADIAKQNDKLTFGKPPKLPDIRLPWDAAPAEGFKPIEKITTQAQLEAELVRLRARYAPFMAELAPALPVTRERTELTTFNWRLATPEDLKDDADARAGRGAWKEVTIPHYGPPADQKATTFYHRELVIGDKEFAAEALFLHFQAVDYGAEVFVNGEKVGFHEGLFGSFEFDIKRFVKPGKNTLTVKVLNDITMMGEPFKAPPHLKFGDKLAAIGGPGWDDPKTGWHRCPAGMGIWLPCRLETRATASVRDIFVRPLPGENKAEVWLEIGDSAKPAEILWSLYGQNFKATLAENQKVTAEPAPAADGVRLVKFTLPIPAEQLRLWSLDNPWLYQLQIQIRRDGKVVDAAKKQFGMRTFTQSLTSVPKGRFYLNGKEIKLRGANMMGHLMHGVMRKDFDRLRDDILLAKAANMTFWRMTQQPCPEEVYEYFDKLGLLAQTDLPAFIGIVKEPQVVASVTAQFREMVRLVRSHPSNAILSYINEPVFAPAASPGTVKRFHDPRKMNLQEMRAYFTHLDAVGRELNPDQVAKWVDGDDRSHVTKSLGYYDFHRYHYWYQDTIRETYLGVSKNINPDWMCGCGEFGAEALDRIELMKKYCPPEWLVEGPGGAWSPAKISQAQQMTIGQRWYPGCKTMKDWVNASRTHQAWGTRLMTESFRRIPEINSFAIHLLIDAWPTGWMKAIVDCERQAKPAYFAYRDALTPLAVNLRPDNFFGYTGDTLKVHAWVLNDTAEAPSGATLRYQAELDGKVVATGHAPADIVASAPRHQGVLEIKLPTAETRRPLTVRLGLFSKDGALLHDASVPIDLIPAADKNGKIPDKGGRPQRIIR